MAGHLSSQTTSMPRHPWRINMSTKVYDLLFDGFKITSVELSLSEYGNQYRLNKAREKIASHYGCPPTYFTLKESLS